MKGKPSQCDLLLQHLKEHGSITGAEAFEKLGIYRLSARIADLRAEGYVIETIYKHEVNKRGEKVTYGEYKLHE
jgi:hypothetical protein